MSKNHTLLVLLQEVKVLCNVLHEKMKNLENEINRTSEASTQDDPPSGGNNPESPDIP